VSGKRAGRSVKTSESSRQQRLEASELGAASVRRAFAETLTRRVFAERLGIHATTLKRWEKQRIVEPQMSAVLGIPTMIYTEADVAFAEALVRVLAQHRGQLSVLQAAQIVRKEP